MVCAAVPLVVNREAVTCRGGKLVSFMEHRHNALGLLCPLDHAASDKPGPAAFAGALMAFRTHEAETGGDADLASVLKRLATAFTLHLARKTPSASAKQRPSAFGDSNE
jgi:hypothetical protein